MKKDLYGNMEHIVEMKIIESVFLSLFMCSIEFYFIVSGEISVYLVKK